MFYGELSSDAAHPSATSLSRHVKRTKVAGDETVLTIEAVPDPSTLEVNETLEFACSALIGICVGTNQILGGLNSGKQLEPVFQEFLSLRKL